MEGAAYDPRSGLVYYKYDHSLGTPPFHCLVRAEADFLLGLYYQIPFCCVMAWCHDTLRNYLPGIRRRYELDGDEVIAEFGYIPCLPCGFQKAGQLAEMDSRKLDSEVVDSVAVPPLRREMSRNLEKIWLELSRIPDYAPVNDAEVEPEST